MWQDKHYGLLDHLLVFYSYGARICPWLDWFFCPNGGLYGRQCTAQHNTDGQQRDPLCGAGLRDREVLVVNNYIWLGPLGEGNHHGDHHDFPRDYRNGFGWSGWALDPTRYAILLLRALRLVGLLNRASKREEAEIHASRKLANLQARSKLCAEASELYQQFEARVLELRKEWLEAVSRWESLHKESKLVQQATARRDEIALRDTRSKSPR